MQKIRILVFLFSAAAFFTNCRQKSAEPETEIPEAVVQTPVTVTSVLPGPVSEYMELNATASFLQSNIVKASANGYIQAVNTAPGQLVITGKILFTLQTKEARNIGTLINNLDTGFRFSGITGIRASQTGYITQLNHQLGDYVQDGEQLAVISTASSFGFILNVPYELRQFVTIQKPVEVLLPDGTRLNGSVVSMMPAVDSVSQTQRVLVRAKSSGPVPENLIVKVRILKTQKKNVIALPKEAILSDESQSGFWVMKMIDSATAVKINVTKGLETEGKVEILEPPFKTGDLVLISGNYGLADTAHVKIVKPE